MSEENTVETNTDSNNEILVSDKNINDANSGIDENSNMSMLPVDNGNLAEITPNKSELSEVRPALLLGEKEMSFRLPLDENDTAGNCDSEESVIESNGMEQNADIPESSDDLRMNEVAIEKDEAVNLENMEVPDDSVIASESKADERSMDEVIENKSTSDVETNEVLLPSPTDGFPLGGNDKEHPLCGIANEDGSKLLSEPTVDDSHLSSAAINHIDSSVEEVVTSNESSPLKSLGENANDLPLSNDNETDELTIEEEVFANKGDSLNTLDDKDKAKMMFLPLDKDNDAPEISSDDKMLMDILPMDENDTRPMVPLSKQDMTVNLPLDEDDVIQVLDSDENKEGNQRLQSTQKIENDPMTDFDEEEEDDVEEVNYSSSDSDIMEVDAEDSNDPLATPKTQKSNELKSNAILNINTGQGSVAIIDELKVPNVAPQVDNDKPNDSRSTSNRRQSQEKPGNKTPNKTGACAPLPTKNIASPVNKVAGTDLELTDDTFVVEAPSFIVPYVYEKLPKESVTEFKRSIARLEYEAKKKKAKEEDDKRRKEEEEMKLMRALPLDGEEPMEKFSDDKDGTGDQLNEWKGYDEEQDRLDKEAEEKILSEIKEHPKKTPSNFFDSTLGNFFFDLGMNIVQERVQVDLLAEQERKAKKDKSAAVMHAIMSLKANIEQSKEKTEYFHMELKKCRYCSFRTESKAVLDHHMETPHMKGTNYRCNVCKLETRTAQEVMSHMFVEHGIRARLERAAALHQCHQCPFEDNQKGKLTKHKVGCDKRFRPEKNQEPDHAWEAPAKIPKPVLLPQQRFQQGKNIMPNMGSLTPQQQMAQQMTARGQNGFSPLQQQQMSLQQLANAGKKQMAQLQQQVGKRGKGQLIQPSKQTPQGLAQQMRQGNMPMGMKNGKPVYMNGQNQTMNQGIHGRQQNDVTRKNNNHGKDASVTIQSMNSRNSNKSVQSKSVSITPLPTARAQNSSGGRSQGAQSQPAMKPGQAAMKAGQPGDKDKKGGFVICEICDGYIKDLEQLRNHMQWIHKVKIHPKMIYNRPPLNCQKCQFRFFTDQGLERHLLGSHGLVTASMQELANQGKDSGRCPVCGKVYQWKLLNHVAKDHQKVLKPAHLSYKCTVCTATFGQYKLFENHVYTAHSGGAKKGGSTGSSTQKGATPSGQQATAATKRPISISDEITID